MHWKTAHTQMGPNDYGTITQLYYGASLRIPVHQERITLTSHRCDTLGEIELPKPAIDDTSVEQMLKLAGLPLTGWVPGYEHILSKYNRPKILYALIDMTRRIHRETGRAEISIAELRDKFEVDDRIFRLHLLNLIEDEQGFIAVGETSIRLASWQEAIQASRQLIASIASRANGDIIRPKVQLRLDDGYTGCSWSLTERGEAQYSLFQLDAPYISIGGDATVIDLALQEHLLPNGWATTYGDNESKYERIRNKIQQGQQN